MVPWGRWFAVKGTNRMGGQEGFPRILPRFDGHQKTLVPTVCAIGSRVRLAGVRQDLHHLTGLIFRIGAFLHRGLVWAAVCIAIQTNE